MYAERVMVQMPARQVSRYSKVLRRELARASGMEFLELLSRPHDKRLGVGWTTLGPEEVMVGGARSRCCGVGCCGVGC
jgi:hypothetical protein